MNPRSMTLMMLLRRGAFAGCVPLAVVYLLGAAAAAQQLAAPAAPAPSAAQAPARGRGPQPVDSRVQIRMHHFAEMQEDIPYALFVSSKVRKDKKAPMRCAHEPRFTAGVSDGRRDRLVDSDDPQSGVHMAERGLLPGVTRIGRRLLVRSDVLLDYLRQKSAPSLER